MKVKFILRCTLCNAGFPHDVDVEVDDLSPTSITKIFEAAPPFMVHKCNKDGTVFGVAEVKGFEKDSPIIQATGMSPQVLKDLRKGIGGKAN